MRIKWMDPHGFSYRRAIAYFSIVVGLGAAGVGAVSWFGELNLNLALNERTRVEFAAFRGMLETGFIQTEMPDDFFAVQRHLYISTNHRPLANVLEPASDGCCGEGGGIWYVTPRVQFGTPEWMRDALPSGLIPRFVGLVRFQLIRLALPFLLMPLLVKLVLLGLRLRKLVRGHCPTCSYSVADLEEVVCPECGEKHAFPALRSWVARRPVIAPMEMNGNPVQMELVPVSESPVQLDEIAAALNTPIGTIHSGENEQDVSKPHEVSVDYSVTDASSTSPPRFAIFICSSKAGGRRRQ